LGVDHVGPEGKVLWETGDINIFKGAVMPDSQSYIFAKLGSDDGGFSMIALDYRGQLKWFVNEDHSSRILSTINDFVIDSVRKQFVVVGEKGKIGDYKNSYYWIAGVDYLGKILWENSWRDSSESRWFSKVFKNSKTGGYIVLTNDNKFDRRHELMNLDSLGKLTKRAPIEPNPANGLKNYDYVLLNIDRIDDSTFFATVVEDPTNESYIYKYNRDLIPVVKYKSYAAGFSRVTSEKYIAWANNQIGCLDKDHNYIFIKEVYPLKDEENIIIHKLIPSRDGGFIGLAGGSNSLTNKNYQFVFKTDSLGNFSTSNVNTEKNQSIMIQPNPAQEYIRIAIPYYFGNIIAKFYNIQGKFLFEERQNEQDQFDISRLASGIYLVDAILIETGEIRRMKLIKH
jgi:hypothetical protein